MRFTRSPCIYLFRINYLKVVTHGSGHGEDHSEYEFNPEVAVTDTTICRPTRKHQGRWFYDCDDFVGILSDYNPVALAWSNQYTQWDLKVMTDVDGYIANPPKNYVDYIDYQYTSGSSVCIDPAATAWDEPGYENDYATGFMAGTLECLDGQTVPEPATPPTDCDLSDAQDKLVGDGTMNCRARNHKYGTIHKCKVTCANGRKPKGPGSTRCQTWAKNDKAIGVWYTRKNGVIRCRN